MFVTISNLSTLDCEVVVALKQTLKNVLHPRQSTLSAAKDDQFLLELEFLHCCVSTRTPRAMGKMRHYAGQMLTVALEPKIGLSKRGTLWTCVIDQVRVFGNRLSLKSAKVRCSLLFFISFFWKNSLKNVSTLLNFWLDLSWILIQSIFLIDTKRFCPSITVNWK